MAVQRAKKKRGPGRPRKEESLGSREDIRQKLIEAALEIVREEGLVAVTTTRLMKAIGMSQSGFYQYFNNVDDCLTAAAETFSNSMRLQLTKFRREIWSDVKPPIDDEVVAQRIRRGFEFSLSASMLDPDLIQLMMFFRHRHDRSPIGDALQQVNLQAREDMAQEIITFTKISGARVNAASIRVYAGLLFAQWSAAVEMLIEDPKLDRRMVIDMLSRAAFAFYVANKPKPEKRAAAAPRAKRT